VQPTSQRLPLVQRTLPPHELMPVHVTFVTPIDVLVTPIAHDELPAHSTLQFTPPHFTRSPHVFASLHCTSQRAAVHVTLLVHDIGPPQVTVQLSPPQRSGPPHACPPKQPIWQLEL
jgi:hypothetical protein